MHVFKYEKASEKEGGKDTWKRLTMDPEINLTLGLCQKPTTLTAKSYSVNWSEGVYWLHLSVRLL